MYEPHFTASDGSTVSFDAPRVDGTGGIIVDQYLWVPRPEWKDEYPGTDGRYVLSSARIAFPDGWLPGQNERVQGTTKTRLPLTWDNFRVLASLPYVRPEEVADAQQHLLLWDLTKKVCLMFLADKSSTEADPEVPGGMHRRVVTEEVSEVVETRPLTDGEKRKRMAGYDVPSVEERTVKKQVVTTTPTAKHAVWKTYCPAKRRPYSQQVLGMEDLYLLRRLAIWYDMRTGKTVTALAPASRLRQEGEVRCLLVVAPKTNMYDPWLAEAELFGWPVLVLEGTPEEDEESIRTAATSRVPCCLIINYERLGDRLPLMEEYFCDEAEDEHGSITTWDAVAVIFDETSAVKNPDASRTKACWQLGRRPLAMCALLNGTPIAQSPEDLWAQMKILDPHGVAWGGWYSTYNRQWLQSAGPGRWVVQPYLRQTFELKVATTSIRCVQSEADQFSGRDKQFRYVPLRATKFMVDQMKNIEAGFVELLDESIGEVNPMLLPVYGALRELCSGVTKWRDAKGEPYQREHHLVDPKLLWVEAYLMANPEQPVVFGVEFNEQEVELQKLLLRLNISFAGTRHRPTVRSVQRITAAQDSEAWEACRRYLRDRAHAGYLTYPDWDIGASAWRTFSPATEWFEWNRPRYLVRTTIAEMGEKCSSRERANGIEDFQQGRVQVFILKTAEAKGITLNRLPAVLAEKSIFPTIVDLSPPWSLIDWDQFMSRCMASDPRTNRSVCTPIYALTIAGGIEDKIMDALRSKKDAQATLLQDGARKGYRNFIHDLVEGMANPDMDGEAEYFEAEAMLARIILGVPPYSKLTETLVGNRLAERLDKKSRKAAIEWLGSEPAELPSFMDPDGKGALLRPEPGEGLREAAWYLIKTIRAAEQAAQAAK